MALREEESIQPRWRAPVDRHYFAGVMALATQHHIPVFVDPKQRDLSIYRGAAVISPNLKELALAA